VGQGPKKLQFCHCRTLRENRTEKINKSKSIWCGEVDAECEVHFPGDLNGIDELRHCA